MHENDYKEVTLTGNEQGPLPVGSQIFIVCDNPNLSDPVNVGWSDRAYRGKPVAGSYPWDDDGGSWEGTKIRFPKDMDDTFLQPPPDDDY